MIMFSLLLIVLSTSPELPEGALMRLVQADRMFDRAAAADDAAKMAEAVTMMVRSVEELERETGRSLEWDFRKEVASARRAGASIDPDISLRSSNPPVWRGRVGGPQRSQQLLEPGEVISEAMVYEGDDIAALYARSDQPVGITLSVTSSSGDTVCQEAAPNGRALCVWRPRIEERFWVRVSVEGLQPVAVELYSN